MKKTKQAKKPEKENFVRLPFFGLPRLLPYLRPYGPSFLMMITLGLVGSAADILFPLFQQYAIDRFVGNGSMDGVTGFVLAYLFLLGAQAFANYRATFVAGRLEQYVGRDLRGAAFDHLQTLSFSYFNQNSVGYIHARVMSDTARIGELISWNLMDGVWHLSYIVGAVVVMIRLNPLLGGLVTAVLPVALLFTVLFQGKLTAANRRVREHNSRLTGQFSEGISGEMTVKALGAEGRMESDFEKEATALRRASVHTMRLRGAFSSFIALSSSLALSLVLYRGGILSRDGVMLVGMLTAFMSYAQGLMEPVRWLVDAVSSLIGAQVNIERFTHLMETKSDVADTPAVIARYGDTFAPKKENWEPLAGAIEFRDVTFRYPDGGEDVLSHFDLTIPAGSSVAIVGETGAGKSTLVNLVCRFFEPTAGAVLIDGRDARERSTLWLHSHIGYVLQTPHLFSGSVRDNLRYGKPEATDDEIMEALRLCHADGIVARMEGGLSAEVGEGGDRLSVGEKQLLSFARALLADPRILVLDEATASVDTVTEQAIQEAIATIVRGRTSLMIAHRLSTVRHADVILCVRDGKIVERGTQAELLAARGYYYRLYTRQFRADRTAAALG